MSHTPSAVADLCRVAEVAGCKIDVWDYGFSAGCHRPGTKLNLLIAEVYREERDGYTGGKIITRKLLDEWLKDNPAGDAGGS